MDCKKRLREVIRTANNLKKHVNCKPIHFKYIASLGLKPNNRKTAFLISKSTAFNLFTFF